MQTAANDRVQGLCLHRRNSSRESTGLISVEVKLEALVIELQSKIQKSLET